MMTQLLLTKLIEKQDLTYREAEHLMEEMMQGELTNAQIAAILTALSIKDEGIDEILGFISIMRKNMKTIDTRGIVVDTCGTGGDGSETFNISTTSSFVVAGAGVKIAKHGNRSASSKCGSADVLESLRVNINLSPLQAEELLDKTGFTFLFAPLYHPSMKYVASVRRDLKIRTVFNFLGPFVSPASVRRQIIGVPDIKIAEKLAEAAVELDYKHLMLVTSEDGLDEISIGAPTNIFEIKGKKIKKYKFYPQSLGIKNAPKSSIKGGDSIVNAEIITRILNGEKGAKRDVVILNAAAAIYIAGKAKNIESGVEMAREYIDKGHAKRVLEKVIKVSNSFK